MPIKKDHSDKRWVEMEFITPGTPEQVWEALATGPGNSAWFTKTTIDERVGGTIQFDFGPHGKQEGEVTVWEPPRRFGYVERNWSGSAPPVATEITITARSGDRCVVRMVHSLFTSSAEWDDQMEGFEQGWPAFFEVLRLYLTHFAGRPGACFTAMSRVEGDHLAVWKRLTDQLGLSGADTGDRRTTPERPERLSGVVERIKQDSRERYVMMRLDAPAPGIVLVGTTRSGSSTNVSVTLYFYGANADAIAAASEQKWQAWLSEEFVPGMGARPLLAPSAVRG